MTLTELTEHLESTHHVYLKKALPRLVALMDKVHQAHSPRHPELTRLQTVVENLRADLEPHLLKEEQIIFPLIRQTGGRRLATGSRTRANPGHAF